MAEEVDIAEAVLLHQPVVDHPGVGHFVGNCHVGERPFAAAVAVEVEAYGSHAAAFQRVGDGAQEHSVFVACETVHEDGHRHYVGRFPFGNLQYGVQPAVVALYLYILGLGRHRKAGCVLCAR